MRHKKIDRKDLFLLLADWPKCKQRSLNYDCQTSPEKLEVKRGDGGLVLSRTETPACKKLVTLIDLDICNICKDLTFAY